MPPRGASTGVRGIWKTRQFILSHSAWILGHDSNIDLWKWNWVCSDGVVMGPKDFNPRVCSHLSLGDLKRNNGNGWDRELIARVFLPEAANSLVNCNAEESLENDRLIWMSNSSGDFSLKSAYWNLCCKDLSPISMFSSLWRSPLHERLKLFLWKVAHDCLLFGARLSRIFGNVIGKCHLCNEEGEDSASHFFSRCSITRSLWLQSKWNARVDLIPLSSGAEVVSWILNPNVVGDVISPSDCKEFSLYASVLYHSLWFFRNDAFHNNVQWTLTEMKKRIENQFMGFWKVLVRLDAGGEERAIVVPRWTHPRPGRIRINVDYATKDN
ncbi:hypothetical protein F8388_024816 [Cannabis sativa]|uniref:Reverse transcriptase zinc-binding domain-containing protein n=1 Tax=Cannabis sativa TaxID=3483 RepID=A0A7J6DZE9_CANSA|nr:hypothetical protein F8388_024816 [Cannabis sativa]